MLANIFTNRYFIGAFVCFIFCVVGSLLYMRHVEQQTAADVARTSERIDQLTSKQNQQPTAEDLPVGDTSQGGHSHGDEWHAEPHEPVEPPQSAAAASEEDWSGITPEQRAQVEKMRAEQLADYIAKWGEPPSPDGSYQHYRDNHGDVHRHYRGTVAIQDYEYKTMFAPTPEELERYKRLRADLKAATLADVGGSWENPSPEVQRLDTALKSLMETAQREIPLPNGFFYYGANNSGFPSEAENERLRSIALREFYQRFGMAHLYEVHWESNKFYEKY